MKQLRHIFPTVVRQLGEQTQDLNDLAYIQKIKNCVFATIFCCKKTTQKHKDICKVRRFPQQRKPKKPLNIKQMFLKTH